MTEDRNLKIASVLALLSLLLLAFNSFLALNIGSKLSTQQQFFSSLIVANATGNVTLGSTQQTQQDDEIAQLMSEIIPRGVPEIYGPELGVTFEDTVNSMNVLAILDGDLYTQNGKLHFADLSEESKQRYLKIGASISCEYCCGATTLIFPNGQVACGCAHSAAMRGLAMYLLKNHASEFTDEQILAELTKWKTLFFPKQMLEKALQLKAQSGEINPTTLNQLPEMVGGC